MEKLEPKYSIVTVYGLIIGTVISITLLFTNKEIITDPMPIYFVVIGFVFVGSVILSFRVFVLTKYYVIEIYDKAITGPSLFGAKWRRITMNIDDIQEMSNNRLLALLGIHIVKSTLGEIIGIWGFDEDRFRTLMSMVNSRKTN